ncbi:FecR family protein [Pedobacter sp. AW31-3R]|uniref:FecR family protein n=1 Tax=Pedobacter sp. AW31-3R TaxID=3445781 RepID=UPI003FA09BA3
MSENKREEELKEILKKYISHQASPSEVEAVDHWYDTLEVSDAEMQLLSEYKKPKSIPLYFWASAACLCLVAAFAAWFYIMPETTRPADRLILTASSERKEIKLADGSVVWLNTGTELLVSGKFGEEERRVILKGEAYFKVAKDRNKPFIIQSGELSTRVLGTSFNINAYPDRERIKISVLTGRVRVSRTTGKSKRILAGQMSTNQTISFFRKTGEFEMNTEDALMITSWKDNKLYIDNASIADIAAQLKGFYHLDVKDLSKASQTDRYTIRFNRESLKGVLEILTLLTKREFEYRNNQITIK